MQQQKRFLLKNIAADTSYFELYSGPNVGSLQLVKSNIIPDKYGFVSVVFNEYTRAQYITYAWKVVDALGNKSDFSLTNVLELDPSEIYTNFVFQKIDSTLIPQYITTTDFSNSLGTLLTGFSRLRTSIQKQDNSYTNFSNTKVIHSSQSSNPTDHAVYIEVQPKSAGVNEVIRIYWRCELSNYAIIERRKILPSVGPWESIYSSLLDSANPLTRSNYIKDYSTGVSGDKFEYRITSTNNISGTITASSFLDIINTNLPSITSFTSNFYNVKVGDTVNLSWVTSNADVVYLDNYSPNLLSPSGSLNIVIKESSDINLVALNTTSGATSERKIYIKAEPKPEIISFKVSNQNVFKNDTINIIWSVNNAYLIELSSDNGTTWETVFQNDKDTFNINFTKKVIDMNYDFKLRATALNGDFVESTVYSVISNDLPLITSFSITPDEYYHKPGENIEISFQADNVNLVTIIGSDGYSYSSTNTISPSNQSDTINYYLSDQILDYPYPVFEKPIIYTINAIRNILPNKTITETKKIVVRIPKPFVENIVFSNLSDITAINLSFDYLYASEFKVDIVGNQNVSIPDGDSLTYYLSVNSSYGPGVFDFSTIKTPLQWSQGDTIDLVIRVRGSNGETLIPVTIDNSSYTIG